MALKIVGSMSGPYHPKIVDNIYVTNSEELVAGRAYYLSGGRWTKAAAGSAIEGICIKSASAGTNVLAVMEIVKPGDILEADYTGTPVQAFQPGLIGVTLDSNGDKVDATVTTGHGVLLSVDSVKGTCRFIARKNLCSAS